MDLPYLVIVSWRPAFLQGKGLREGESRKKRNTKEQRMRTTERTQEGPSSNERKIWEAHQELLKAGQAQQVQRVLLNRVMTQPTPPISCHHTNVLTATLCEVTRPMSKSLNYGHVPFPSYSFLEPLPLSSPAFRTELPCGAASSGPYKHSHVPMMIIQYFQSFIAPSSKWEFWGL